MYGIQDKINQILRGAETIKKNSMDIATTDTPRVENYLQNFNSHFVPAELARNLERELNEKTNLVKITKSVINDLITKGTGVLYKDCCNKRKKAEKEVARLRGLLKDHAKFLRKNGFDRQADGIMRHATPTEEPDVVNPESSNLVVDQKSDNMNEEAA